MEVLSPALVALIETATAKALATDGPYGLNVVPVSVVTVEAQTICLYDFFMDKTVKNLTVKPAIALTCWQGLEGIQIKGVARYENGGPRFLRAVTEMQQRFPKRVLSGIVLITPTHIYDVTADSSRAGALLASRGS